MKQNQPNSSASAKSTTIAHQSKANLNSSKTKQNRGKKNKIDDYDSGADDAEPEDTDEEDDDELDENFRSIGYESKGLDSLLSCAVIEQNLLPLRKPVDSMVEPCLRELMNGATSSISSRKPVVYQYEVTSNS